MIPPVIVLDNKIEDDNLLLTCEIESPAILAYDCSSNHRNSFDKPN